MDELEKLLDHLEKFRLAFVPQVANRTKALQLAHKLNELSGIILKAYPEDLSQVRLLPFNDSDVLSTSKDSISDNSLQRQGEVTGDEDEVDSFSPPKPKRHHGDDMLTKSPNDVTSILNSTSKDIMPVTENNDLRKAIADQIPIEFTSLESQQQRKLEANKISERCKKPTKKYCGVFYMDTLDEKSFCETVSSAIHARFPSIKDPKQTFYWMTFALLHRFSCSTCSKCIMLPPDDFRSLLSDQNAVPNIMNYNAERRLAIDQRSQSLPSTLGLQPSTATLSNENTNLELNIRNVLTAIDEVSDYFKLGIALDLSNTTLNEIKKNCDEVFQRKAAVIEKWLQTDDPPPSWNILIEAIRGKLINNSSLATKIKKDYT